MLSYRWGPFGYPGGPLPPTSSEDTPLSKFIVHFLIFIFEDIFVISSFSVYTFTASIESVEGVWRMVVVVGD